MGKEAIKTAGARRRIRPSATFSPGPKEAAPLHRRVDLLNEQQDIRTTNTHDSRARPIHRYLKIVFRKAAKINCRRSLVSNEPNLSCLPSRVSSMTETELLPSRLFEV